MNSMLQYSAVANLPIAELAHVLRAFWNLSLCTYQRDRCFERNSLSATRYGP